MAKLNDTQLRTYRALRSLLNETIDTTRRRAIAKSDETQPYDESDYPLVDPRTLATIPQRARPAVRAAAKRLRELAADGDNAPAWRELDPLALSLVPELPSAWPSASDQQAAGIQSPDVLAARIPR